MIIYNHKKEFVGIEEADLKALGVINLAELQSEAADFADLFVKTPGHVHNFKYIHWIDFLFASHKSNENRAILQVKGKCYYVLLTIHTFYLSDAPKEPAYGIVLNELRELTRDEASQICANLSIKTAQEPSLQPRQEKDTATTKDDVALLLVQESIEDMQHEPSKQKQEDVIPIALDDVLASNEKQSESFIKTKEEEVQGHLDREDIDKIEEVKKKNIVESAKERKTPFVIRKEDANRFGEYRFDPVLASKELGLPANLIKEFIEDFVAQSDEFKHKLYESFAKGDIKRLRSLSRKLKVVAANLRIKDAYEILVTIGTSDNMDLVQYKLDYYYNVVVQKLKDKEVIGKVENQQ